MRVLFLTLGPPIVASSRTRVYQYIPHLERQGIRSRVIAFNSLVTYQNAPSRSSASRNALFTRWQLLKFLALAPFYDVVFVQKVLIPIPLQRMLQRLNPRLVFDYDDAIYLDQYQSGARRRLNHQLAMSRAVIVENDSTVQYARRYLEDTKIVRITGPIDTDRYCPHPAPRNRDRKVIGWIGSSTTAPYLALVEFPLRQVAARHPQVSFALVGLKENIFSGIRMNCKPWSLEAEVADLQDFDIGIMPLPDDEWTRGKGGYKLLQYMAVGIPCIASPVGINVELIQDGKNGLLANNEHEWTEKLELLISNPRLCAQMGECGRHTALERYSFQAATPRFITTLERVAGG